MHTQLADRDTWRWLQEVCKCVHGFIKSGLPILKNPLSGVMS